MHKPQITIMDNMVTQLHIIFIATRIFIIYEQLPHIHSFIVGDTICYVVIPRQNQVLRRNIIAVLYERLWLYARCNKNLRYELEHACFKKLRKFDIRILQNYILFLLKKGNHLNKILLGNNT